MKDLAKVAKYITLREEGKTYEEIGKMFGVTKQAVEISIRQAEQTFESNRLRKYTFKCDDIVYQGLYDVFDNDITMTVSKLSKILGVSRPTVKRMLCTGTNTKLPINTIQKLIEYSGKSFEELFAPRMIKEH